MGDGEHRAAPRNVIGPTFTVALPFSKITSSDAEVREAVAELAHLVARLAKQTDGGDMAEIKLVRDAAEKLATRMSSRDR